MNPTTCSTSGTLPLSGLMPKLDHFSSNGNALHVRRWLERKSCSRSSHLCGTHLHIQDLSTHYWTDSWISAIQWVDLCSTPTGPSHFQLATTPWSNRTPAIMTWHLYTHPPPVSVPGWRLTISWAAGSALFWGKKNRTCLRLLTTGAFTNQSLLILWFLPSFRQEYTLKSDTFLLFKVHLPFCIDFGNTGSQHGNHS